MSYIEETKTKNGTIWIEYPEQKDIKGPLYLYIPVQCLLTHEQYESLLPKDKAFCRPATENDLQEGRFAGHTIA